MSVKNDNIDTLPEADAVLKQLIMLQKPTERLAQAIAASNRVAQQCKDAILRSNPGMCSQEVRLRFIELNYGQELANAVREFQAKSK